MKSARRSVLGGLALICLIIMPSAVQAQSSENVVVEVAFFSQPSSRLLPAEPTDPDWADQALVLSETANSQVRQIDPTRHELSDEVNRLTQQGYRLHLHKAWTQPLGLGNAVAIAGGDTPAAAMSEQLQRVQGLVMLDQSRGLEANVAFWLNHTAADGSVVSEKLSQTRKLRLDETHYLDHPSLGILIRVWRLD